MTFCLPRHAFRLLAVLILSSICLPAFAQYTDWTALNDLGGPQEFARRRAELAKQAKTGYVLLAAKIILPQADHYREDNDFYYYTGIADPGAVMLLDCSNAHVTIFEPQQAERESRVYGKNLLSLAATDRERLGYSTVVPLATLDATLGALFGRSEQPDLWMRLGFADKPDGARP